MAAVIDVYLPIPAWRPYSYAVPETGLPDEPQGCRVVVPVRRGWKVGVCCGVRNADPPEDVAPAREFLDRRPAIPCDLWDLGMWMSSYYMCPPGITFTTMLPGPCRPRMSAVLEPRPALASRADTVPAELKAVVELLSHGPVLRNRLERLMGVPDVERLVRWLIEQDLASWKVKVGPEPASKQMAIATLVEAPDPVRVTAAGQRILEALRASGGRLPVAELVVRARVGRSVVATLERAGLVVVEHTTEPAPSLRDSVGPPLSLTPAQRGAVDAVSEAVRNRVFQSFLLHGVTGSGKTEVYLTAAAEAIAQGQSVVCLVPEIALTAQMLARFRGRFGDRVVLVHSGLRPGERLAAWARSTVPGSLVIGPRSAVFAPVSNLGLIVVDEEHDASYKQERDPRYNGRDVAIMRAHHASCPALLGSATPSLETYQHCLSGKHLMLELPDRVDGWAMPAVSIVDMRAEPKVHGPRVFSSLLRRRMEEVIGRGEQVLLLLNRRGYARSVQCADCGFIPQCPDCDIALTFHRRDYRYVCHYCDYAEPAHDACPSCQGHRLGFGSLGTERVDEELRSLFPDKRTLRMDRDTTRSRGAHVRIIDAMEREEASVLVGTQMIAKGLDLPKVTLVGVVNADTPLQFPDFRAGERAFQLLAQVAGRAGRSAAGGEVVLQSFLVDYPALLAAARHDYQAFAHEELLQRREAGYPPFASLVRLEVRGRVRDAVDAHANAIAAGLRAVRPGQGGRYLGPAPPLLPRLRGLHRRQLLVFHRARSRLHAWVRDALSRAGEHYEGTRLVVDVDPLETA